MKQILLQCMNRKDSIIKIPIRVEILCLIIKKCVYLDKTRFIQNENTLMCVTFIQVTHTFIRKNELDSDITQMLHCSCLQLKASNRLLNRSIEMKNCNLNVQFDYCRISIKLHAVSIKSFSDTKFLGPLNLNES